MWRNGITDDRAVSFTAPDTPGRIRITASVVDGYACLQTQSDESDEDRIKRCAAVIDVNVRRESAPQPSEEAPANVTGEIPSILTDADGNQYEVFTPVEGGSFNIYGYSIRASAGAVPNGEYFGIRMAQDGAASNVGMSHGACTRSGSFRYAISAVDSSKQAISSYLLEDPATVCLPVPAELRSNIVESGDQLRSTATGRVTILTAKVQIGTSGMIVCGMPEQPACIAGCGQRRISG